MSSTTATANLTFHRHVLFSQTTLFTEPDCQQVLTNNSNNSNKAQILWMNNYSPTYAPQTTSADSNYRYQRFRTHNNIYLPQEPYRPQPWIIKTLRGLNLRVLVDQLTTSDVITVQKFTTRSAATSAEVSFSLVMVMVMVVFGTSWCFTKIKLTSSERWVSSTSPNVPTL